MNDTTPPTIIAFASGKGGVGKSTACLGIAGALASNGKTVHVVDFDQNQTLWAWYASHDNARAIPGLTVERAPKTGVAEFIESLYFQKTGYILIDLAGSLDEVMMLVAAFATMVIIPTKLGMADVLQADKLAEKVHAIGERIGKSIAHCILLNEMPFHQPSKSQSHMLNQIIATGHPRFNTWIHDRPVYGEPQLTGLPLHFNDQNRDQTKKAVAELDMLVTELLAALDHDQLKAAA